jgi:hypothetical protein
MSPKWFFPYRFSNENFVCVYLPICATCTTYLTLSDLITVVIFDDEYKLWIPTSCNFLHPYVTSSHSLSLSGPNILLSTLNPCSSLEKETKFHTHTKQQIIL